MKINNKAIRCYNTRRIVRKRNSIWITEHKKAVVNSGIPTLMEILKHIRTQEFKNHGKKMQANDHNS
jgi:hypothetical protein